MTKSSKVNDGEEQVAIWMQIACSSIAKQVQILGFPGDARTSTKTSCSSPCRNWQMPKYYHVPGVIRHEKSLATSLFSRVEHTFQLFFSHLVKMFFVDPARTRRDETIFGEPFHFVFLHFSIYKHINSTAAAAAQFGSFRKQLG